MAVASAGPYAICTSLQADSHTNTSSLTGRMLFPMHNRVKALEAMRPGYKTNKIANEVKHYVLLLLLS